MASDFDNMLSDNKAAWDTFAESVTYRKFGGTTRTIMGELVWEEVFPSDGSPAFWQATIDVHNDGTTGILASELNYGRDAINCTNPFTGVAADLLIIGPTPVWIDGGRMKLRLNHR